MKKRSTKTNDEYKLILKELEQLNENHDKVKVILDSRFSELNKKISVVLTALNQFNI